MDVALLLARVLLTGIFGLAAVTKLANLAGSTGAMRNFGLPRRLAITAGIALPVAELAVAVTLIPRAWAWWGALGAAVLLVTLIVGIAVNLALGRAPYCHCVGQLHSAPVGWPTVARNSALAAVAAFILWQGRDDPGPSMVAWAGELSTIEAVTLGIGLLALALVAVVGWLTVQLLRQNGRLLIRIEVLEAARSQGGQLAGTARPRTNAPEAGPPVGTKASASSIPSVGAPAPASTIPLHPIPSNGSAMNGNSGGPGRAPTPTLRPLASRIGEPAPAPRLPDLDGNEVDLSSFTGEPSLVLFWNPGCRFCARMLDDLKAWEAAQRPDAPRLRVISTGSVEANREMSLRSAVLLDQGFSAGRSFGVSGTPSAVLVDEDGKIASDVAVGAPAVLALAGTAQKEAPSRDG